jgi:hypothetical protein
MSSLSRDRLKDIALLYLMYADSVPDLKIPLFGEGSGMNLEFVSPLVVKNDAQKLATHLDLSLVEAVDFIRTVSDRKHHRQLLEKNLLTAGNKVCA